MVQRNSDRPWNASPFNCRCQHNLSSRMARTWHTQTRARSCMYTRPCACMHPHKDLIPEYSSHVTPGWCLNLLSFVMAFLQWDVMQTWWQGSHFKLAQRGPGSFYFSNYMHLNAWTGEYLDHFRTLSTMVVWTSNCNQSDLFVTAFQHCYATNKMRLSNSAL